MNKYINPEMDVKAFAVEDVITTSGTITDVNSGDTGITIGGGSTGGDNTGGGGARSVGDMAS